jgi:hypothetical protein
LSNDGAFEMRSANGNGVRGKLNLSDPNQVYGTGVAFLGKRLGMPMKYPGGSTTAQVTLRGSISNGKFQGQYVEKSQTGQFLFTLAPGN